MPFSLPGEFLSQCRQIFLDKIKYYLTVHNSLKCNIVLECSCSKLVDGEIVREYRSFATKNFEILKSSNLEETFELMKNIVLHKLEESATERGSGWAFEKVINLALNVCKYNPFCGSGPAQKRRKTCTFVELPTRLKKMGTSVILNISNSDNACFARCILAEMLKIYTSDFSVSKKFYRLFEFRKYRISYKGV